MFAGILLCQDRDPVFSMILQQIDIRPYRSRVDDRIGTSILIVISLCAVLSVISYKFGLLTRSGAIASFAVGMLIGSWLCRMAVITDRVRCSGLHCHEIPFQAQEGKGDTRGKERRENLPERYWLMAWSQHSLR